MYLRNPPVRLRAMLAWTGLALVACTSATSESGPVPSDPDGDGLTTAQEQAGWDIFVDFNAFGLTFPGFLERVTVSSDPLLFDTDGDGLSDREEAVLGTNPQREDTDGDGLSDYDEVHRWGTVPVSVDTDRDARPPEIDPDRPPDARMFDGAELNLDDAGNPSLFATSPSLADTDGDGVRDPVELDNPLRSPLFAELPLVGMELIDPVDVRLFVTWSDDSSNEQGFGATMAQSESESRSRNVSTVDAESWWGGVGSSDAILLGIPGGWRHGNSVFGGNNTSETRTTTLTESESREFSEAHDSWQQTSQTRVTHSARGAITLGLRLRNDGIQAFTVADLGIGVRAVDPTTGRYRSITVLQPPVGFDSFALGPGASSPVIPFVDNDVDPALVRQFMASPASLLLEPVGYELYGGSGQNLAFEVEAVARETASLAIDWDDGSPTRLTLATNVDRGEDGARVGTTLGRVLDEAGIPYSQAPAGNQDFQVLTELDGLALIAHTGPPPALDDPPYPAGYHDPPRNLRRFWGVIAAGRDADVDLSGDFSDLRLRAGDEFVLAYMSDEDRDGVWDRKEAMLGADTTSLHSDGTPDNPAGDGLSDYYEMSVGWDLVLTGVDAPPPRRVYPSPIRIDGDGDGLDDMGELLAGTDPNHPDSDRDGVMDPNDPEPLLFENTPPEIDLSIFGDLLIARTEVRVQDIQGNTVQIQVEWGDGRFDVYNIAHLSEEERQDYTLDVDHTFPAPGTYSVRAIAVDSVGEEVQDLLTIELSDLPLGVTYEQQFVTPSDRDGCNAYDPSNGLAPYLSYEGTFEACYLYDPEPGDEGPYYDIGGVPGLDGSSTFAVWAAPGHSGGWLLGEVGYPGLVLDGSVISAVVGWGGDRDDERAISGFAGSRDSWTFFAGRFAQVGNDTHVTVFRDGVPLASHTVYGWVNGVDASCPTTVGRCNFGNFGCVSIFDEVPCPMAQKSTFEGTVDDVRVYDRALTDREIYSLYANKGVVQ